MNTNQPNDLEAKIAEILDNANDWCECEPPCVPHFNQNEATKQLTTLFTQLSDERVREARIEELNDLVLYQSTRVNGTDDIQITLDYLAGRLNQLRRGE